MEPKHLLHDRRDARRRDSEVVEPGGDSRAAERRRALGHEPRAERDTAGIVHMLLPLRLEPGHVNVRRALRFAGLAREAEVHHLGDFRPRPRVGRGRIGERLPQDIRPGPRRVALVARSHVARAHRAADQVGLAALADARAFFSGPEHAAGVGEPEHRVAVRLAFAGHDPQRRVHRRRVDDFSRIQNPLRVERPLHALEQGIALGAHHRADEFAAEPAVTVLAGETAAVFLHERRHVGGDITEHLQAGRRAQVEERPQVQLTRSSVGVVDAVDRVLFGEEPVELGDVGRQILHGHRGVFDDLTGLGVARHVVDEALTGTAQLPHLVAVSPVEHGIGVAEAGGPEVALEVGERPLHAASVGVLELDDEHRARVSDDELPVAGLLGIVLRAGEDLVVDQFAGRERDLAAAALHGDERGPQRLVDRTAVDADERTG